MNDGHYDILDPQGRVVLPSVWDAVVEPGWEVSMHMWPMNQDRIEEKRAHQARFDGRVGLGCGEERLRPNWHLGSETPCGFDGEEEVIIIDEGRGQPIRAARDQPLHWPHRLADIDESDVGDSMISIAASEQGRPRTPAFLNLLTTTQRTAEPIIFCQNCKRHLEIDPRIERFPGSPNQRLERHLLAEKQLTATLEEAIVDLESQNKGVRAEMEGWRINCRAYEARLARMYVGTGFGAVDGEATKMGDGGLAVRKYDSGEGVVAGCEKLGGLGAEESFDEWEEAVVED